MQTSTCRCKWHGSWMQKDLQRFRSANCITYNISAKKKAASPCIIHPSKSSQLVTYFTYIHNIYIYTIVHIEFPCKSSMLPPSLTVHDSRRRYAQSYHNYSRYLVISRDISRSKRYCHTVTQLFEHWLSGGPIFRGHCTVLLRFWNFGAAFPLPLGIDQFLMLCSVAMVLVWSWWMLQALQ